jgi:hypothetical protein
MDCLIDYIGLTGCGTSSPVSGLFINSLPGISLKSIAQLADAEQQTYVGVWDDVQLRATKRLQLMLNSTLSKQYKVKTARYSIRTKEESQSSNTGSYSAPAYKFESYCSSTLSYHHIESITCRKVNNSSTIGVTVYNAEDNSILYNAAFATNSDTYQTVNLNEDFYYPEIIVKVTISGNTYYNDEFKSIDFGGGNIKTGVYSANTFTQSNYSYGISVNYGLRCSLDNLACDSKDLFALPLWYLLGSELMLERIVSERINKWTVDRKQAEELKAYYDAEAEKALSQAIAGVSISDYDCCIQCDPMIGVKEAYL